MKRKSRLTSRPSLTPITCNLARFIPEIDYFKRQLNPIIRVARHARCAGGGGDIKQTGPILTGTKRNFRNDKTEQICRWVLSAE